jgi:hypothetical protein
LGEGRRRSRRRKAYSRQHWARPRNACIGERIPPCYWREPRKGESKGVGDEVKEQEQRRAKRGDK